MELSDWRKDYLKNQLKENDLIQNPIDLFKMWIEQAINDGIEEPNSMSLATCGLDMIPYNRIVLLKEIDNEEFIFYTNYNSTKAKNIEQNNNVSLNFYWDKCQRQVRIVGKAKKLSKEKNIKYFDSRPFESKISAVASPQSEKIDLNDLLKRVEEIGLKKDIKCPEYWGGYCVKVEKIEFWQGKRARLHDRFMYNRDDFGWKISRLAP